MRVDDVICAVASAPVGAARGVVRISGAGTPQVLGRLLPADTRLPARGARRIATTLDLPPPLGPVDCAVLVWPTWRSYTGQPSAELHLPGAMPLLAAAVDATVAAGARPARPGEFTLRAFLAGRLDLTQAEAVLGVIDADDQRSLQAALTQLAGGLAAPLAAVRGRLLDLLSHVEAGLDFVDEDIEFISDQDLLDQLQRVGDQLRSVQQQLGARQRSAGPPLVVLRGKPNAGKSRLLNRLAGRETAIVARRAGTTRDPVEAVLMIDQLQIRLVDTAGLEAAATEIDREAQAMAQQLERQADLRLICVDLAARSAPPEPATEIDNDSQTPELWVGTKADLLPEGRRPVDQRWVVTSSTTGEGLDRLRRGIVEALEQQDRQEVLGVAGTAVRCGASLRQAVQAIDDTIELIHSGGGQELAAAEMRSALAALGEVTGEVYTDDILDRIFGRFCIGK